MNGSRIKIFKTFAPKSWRKVARNCLRMYHRASRINFFLGPLSEPGPHALSDLRHALSTVNHHFSKLENTVYMGC